MTHRISIVTISAFIIFAVFIQADAEENRATFARKKIAVLDIGANNVPASYGNIVRNSLEVSLFNSDIFQLLDRDELKTAASRLKLGIGSDSSDDDIIKLGKSVSAQFLVSGSIDKIKDVKVTLKVYSIAEGVIICAYTREISSPDESDKAVKYIMEKILRDINEYITTGHVRKGFFENHSIRTGLRFSYIQPTGDLSSLINPAFGFRYVFDIDNIFLDNAFAGFDIGYAKMSGKENSGDSAAFTEFLASAGYRHFIVPSFYLKGELAGGASYIVLRHGSGDGFSMKDNSEKRSIDPAFRAGFGIGFVPGHDIHLELTGCYTRFFEASSPMNEVAASLGVAIRF